MKTNPDIQNTLYGVMHTQLAPPAFAPHFDADTQLSLMDQLERMFQLTTMLRHAMMASRLLMSLVDKPAEELDGIVKRFACLSVVQRVDQKDPDSITLAIASAAILTTAKAGRQTALEKVEGALALLSRRYQADW